jgi:hypothetical protein
MFQLSILIPTTVKRIDYYCPNIVKYLDNQIKECKAEKDVQLLWLGDNYTMTVGEKRNTLLKMARGRFLTMIDDDDSTSHDYVKSVLDCIAANPNTDVIVYDCITTVDGKRKTLSKYSKNFTKYIDKMGGDGIRQWRGLVAHTMVWRSTIAKTHMFPDKNYEEDINWVKRANGDIVNEARIDKVLYFYRFNRKTTETRHGQK